LLSYVSIEPSQGSLNDPSAWQQLKAGSLSSAFDNVGGPIAELDEGLTQVRAVVHAVGEQVTQPGKQLVDGVNDQRGTIAISDIGGVHLGGDQQTTSTGHNVALTAVDFFGCIVATRPPSVVLTD